MALTPTSEDAKLFDIIHVYTLVSLCGSEFSKVRTASFRLLAELFNRAVPEKRQRLAQRSVLQVAVHRLKYRGVKEVSEAEKIHSSFVKILLSDFLVEDLEYLPFEYFPILCDELRINGVYGLLVFVRELCKNRKSSDNDLGLDGVIDKCFQLINILFERSSLIAKQLIEFGLTLTVKMAFATMDKKTDDKPVSRCSSSRNSSFKNSSSKNSSSKTSSINIENSSNTQNNPPTEKSPHSISSPRHLYRTVFLIILKCIYSADELYKTFEDVMYTLCISKNSRFIVYDSIIQLLAEILGESVVKLIATEDHENLERSELPKMRDSSVSDEEITSRVFKLLRRSCTIPMHILVSQQKSGGVFRSSSFTNLTVEVSCGSGGQVFGSQEYNFPVTLLKLLWELCKGGKRKEKCKSFIKKSRTEGLFSILSVVLLFLLCTKQHTSRCHSRYVVLSRNHKIRLLFILVT